MYYVTGRHYTYMGNQYLSWFFLACIVMPNLIFMAYWAYNMRLEVLKEMYRKNVSPKIFCLVACESRDKFYERCMKLEDEISAANA
jgi:hypothetical protein